MKQQDIRVRPVREDKRALMPLLLVGDESEDMVLRYLDRGEAYVLEEDGETVAAAVVTDEGNGVCEVKNLSVRPDRQRRGYGSALLRDLAARYAPAFHTMQLGTGESPLTLPFYRENGFVPFRRIPDFFTDHYPRPIVEEGVVLRDMIYLKKTLREEGRP